MSDTFYLDPISKKYVPLPADEGFERPVFAGFEFAPNTPPSDADLAELAALLECPVASVPNLILGEFSLSELPERLRENYRFLSPDEFWALVDL